MAPPVYNQETMMMLTTPAVSYTWYGNHKTDLGSPAGPLSISMPDWSRGFGTGVAK